jgi:hypothetical protein
MNIRTPRLYFGVERGSTTNQIKKIGARQITQSESEEEVVSNSFSVGWRSMDSWER